VTAPRVATYDPATDAGMVRLTINDVDISDPVFDDTEIAAFLTMEGGVVDLAAARALETLASNESMVAKVVKTLDYETNGPAVARDLRAAAKVLRERADDQGDDWAIAEFIDGPFAYRERIEKQWMRGLG
jgi:hypothetical protein